MSDRTAAEAHTAPVRGQKDNNRMLSRTFHSSVVGRSASMRRLRRRSVGGHRLLCNTNGCATLLTIDLDRGLATCPVCGYTRRLN